MGAAAEDWQLYVDESGTFEPNGFVGGWLARGQHTPARDADLREAIRRIVPLVPWPPHMAEMNVAAAWPFWYERLTPRPSAVPDEISHAAAALASWPRWAELVREAPEARSARDALLEATSWLQRTHPSVSLSLQSIVDRTVNGLVRKVSSTLARHHDSVFVVGAVAPPETSATRGPGAGDHAHSYDAAAFPGNDPDRSWTDRYLATLEALLERVTTVVSSHHAGDETPPRVWVRLEGRAVRIQESPHAEPGVSPSTQFLSAGLLKLISRRAQTSPRIPGAPRVDLTALAPHGKRDPDYPVGLVVADMLCNRLGRILFERARNWPATRSACQTAVGHPVAVVLPLVADGKPLPTLAAAGPARDHVRRCVRSGCAAPMEATVEPRPWVRDQANLWADALVAAGARLT